MPKPKLSPQEIERNKRRFEAVMNLEERTPFEGPISTGMAVVIDRTQRILSKLEAGQAEAARKVRTTRYKG